MAENNSDASEDSEPEQQSYRLENENDELQDATNLHSAAGNSRDRS